MAFKTTCPHCGRALSVQDSYLHKKLKCPKCSTKFIVDPVGQQPATNIARKTTSEPKDKESQRRVKVAAFTYKKRWPVKYLVIGIVVGVLGLGFVGLVWTAMKRRHTTYDTGDAHMPPQHRQKTAKRGVGEPRAMEDAAESSETAAEYRRRGELSADRGDYDGAIRDFTKAIEANPKDAEVYLLRGIVHNRKGSFEDAIADYSQAVKVNPRLTGAWFALATARRDNGDFEGALRDYEKCLIFESSPQVRGMAERRIADLRMKLNREGLSKVSGKEIDLEGAEAYYKRGLVRYEMREIEGAIADFTRAIEIDPNYFWAYFKRGVARIRKGDLDAAIADLTKVIELNPKLAEGYMGRGMARNRRGDVEGAIEDYEKFLKLAPNHPQAPPTREMIMHLREKLKLQDSSRK